MITAPTSIDLSRLSAPEAIETVGFEALLTAFRNRFEMVWNDARSVDPSLPAFEIGAVVHDPAVRIGRAWTYLRMLDRQRVNDAIKAVLAPLATGADLDHVAARQNLARLTITPASGASPAVMESDAALLRRYLLSFDRPAAGSRDRYLIEAWTAWPHLHDARVNGFEVHGRRGDTDVVIIGPAGRAPTSPERALVSAAVLAPAVKPEAVSVAVINATRLEYSVELVIEMAPGPDAALIRQETIGRVRAAGDARTLIGAEIPAGFIAGAAYGPNVVKVRDIAPVIIEPQPYTVPVLAGISVAVEVRA